MRVRVHPAESQMLEPERHDEGRPYEQQSDGGICHALREHDVDIHEAVTNDGVADNGNDHRVAETAKGIEADSVRWKQVC